jgi:hypothetical protein
LELGLEFHILIPPQEIDEEFRTIYMQNNMFASEKYLPVIYNYYLNFSNKINLPGLTGTGAIGWFRNINFPISAQSLAVKSGVDRWKFAQEYYDCWINSNKNICQENDYRLLDLFYIEERIANWGTQIQVEKDIAQEEIKLFCSRNLIDLFLSNPSNYLKFPRFLFHQELIKNLWPKLLDYPINPSFRNKLIYFLDILNLQDVLNIYRFSRFKNMKG